MTDDTSIHTSASTNGARPRGRHISQRVLEFIKSHPNEPLTTAMIATGASIDEDQVSGSMQTLRRNFPQAVVLARGVYQWNAIMLRAQPEAEKQAAATPQIGSEASSTKKHVDARSRTRKSATSVSSLEPTKGSLFTLDILEVKPNGAGALGRDLNGKLWTIKRVDW